ncbi:MAG: hypothetical protein IJ422_02610 [Oscillospiraceae bacterium]|nr:hypothetical protein [Oscillospiraceae bacterium]
MVRGNMRWRMKMDGKWLSASAAFGGVAFFLRALYFFGFMNLADVGIARILFQLALPMIVLVGYFVLLRGLRFSNPEIYSFIAAGYCLLTMIGCFFSGSILRIILGCIWYLICGGLFVITGLGFLGENRFAGWAMFLAAVVRLAAFNLGNLLSIGMILELAELMGLCCFGCMPMCFKPENRVRKRSKIS